MTIIERTAGNTPIGRNDRASSIPIENSHAKIDRLARMLAEDIREGKPLDDLNITKYLNGLSKTELRELVNYIRGNYELQLRIPAGKIVLAKEMDDLEHSRLDYSPRHIMVMLYSIKGKKDPSHSIMEKGKPAPSKELKMPSRLPSELGISSSNTDFINPSKIMIGDGNEMVTFSIQGMLALKDPYLRGKLQQMYCIISNLNKCIPKKPITSVTIQDDLGDSHYNPPECIISGHQISIGINTGAFLSVTAHEMGHAVFAVMMEDKTNKCDWEKIFFLSLGYHGYELVDDSNYVNLPDPVGHPKDEPTELFASAMAAYVQSPYRFIDNINDKDTPKTMKRLGRLMFCFIRERVFKGRVFRKDDPYKDIKLAGLLSTITDEELFGSFVNAVYGKDFPTYSSETLARLLKNPELIIKQLLAGMGSKKEDTRIRTLYAMQLLKLQDERLMRELIKALGDKSSEIRKDAIQAATHLGTADPRMIAPLKKALTDNDPLIKCSALYAFEELKFKDVALVEYFIPMLRDKNEAVRMMVLDTVKELGIKDERLIRPITALLLNDPEYAVRKSAAQAIGRIWTGDNRLLAPLFAVLMDKDMRINNRTELKVADVMHYAAEAIKGLKINNEEIKRLLLEALKDNGSRWYFITRVNAIIILNYCGIRDERFIKPLMEALKTPYVGTRQWAMTVISKWPINQGFTELLLAVLNDKNEFVRASATDAIVRFMIKDHRFISPLHSAIKDKNARVRMNALIALKNIGIADERFRDSINSCLRDPDKDVRDTAIHFVTQLSLADPRFIEPLLLALTNGDQYTRTNAVTAIGAIFGEGPNKTYDKRVLPALVDALNDDYIRVTFEAHKVLDRFDIGLKKRIYTEFKGVTHLHLIARFFEIPPIKYLCEKYLNPHSYEE